jgi:hypothetical protein
MPKRQRLKGTSLLDEPLPKGALLRVGTNRMRVNLYFAGEIAISADHRTVAAGSYDAVAVLDATTGELRTTFRLTGKGILDSLALSPDGRRLGVIKDLIFSSLRRRARNRDPGRPSGPFRRHYL